MWFAIIWTENTVAENHHTDHNAAGQLLKTRRLSQCPANASVTPCLAPIAEKIETGKETFDQVQKLKREQQDVE